MGEAEDAAKMLYEGAKDACIAFKLLRKGHEHNIRVPQALEVIDAHIDELEYAIAAYRASR